MINALQLKNFKCFENQKFNLGNLTLLSGLNGTGKSSVIQSLLSIRQSKETDLLDDIGLSLNGSLVSMGKGKDILFVDAQEELIAIELFLDSGLKASWTFDYQKEADVLKLVPGSEGQLTTVSEALFNDRFQYLAAERVGPRVSYLASDYFVRQKRRLGNQGEYTAHYLALFGDEEVTNKAIHHPNARNTQLKGQVEAWLSEISPGAQIHTTHHYGMDLVNLEYSFIHGTSVGDKYRATNVGFGLTYTLPVLTALLAATAGDLLIIENPEAHLHPVGQRKLGELLAQVGSSGVQVIVESHSDHLLNGIRLAVHGGRSRSQDVKILFFVADRSSKKKSTTVLEPNLDQNGRIDKWPEGFFDEWDRSLEQLLAPRA